MKTKSKLLIAELALISASVLIFRSLWMLLDKLGFMHGTATLAISLIVGIALSIPALRYLISKG